jgi:hypothetical protein
MKAFPVYLHLRKMVNPDTGEMCYAFVCADATARMICQDRKYKTGTYRAELKQPRNARFLRLVHALGRRCSEHIDGFPSDAHDAIKRLQLESGAECDLEAITLDLGPVIGKHQVQVKKPRSIAFDTMTEDRFVALFRDMCRHLCHTYWPHLTEQQIEEQAELMNHE